MNRYDVVVVGAGPAGGQLARSMAVSGFKVLLVEQHEDFSRNDFSSAATLLSTLEQFGLPESIVGSFWSDLVAVTTNTKHVWTSPEKLGAVLDFAKLKQFLANEVQSHGGDVRMGYRYVRYSQTDGETLVTLKERAQQRLETVSTKVLVDATGFARSVMYEKRRDQPELIGATGIEYVIEVDEETYRKYLDSIFFFLGYEWMPKGYSWVFPMEKYRLKVGAGRFNIDHKIVAHTESLRYYINILIRKHVNPKHYEIVDVHGSMIKYSKGLKDIYCRDNVIAIGDAVSTVNPLGGEGIRHGMYSADVAAEHIKRYLENEITDFRAYAVQMRRHFLPKWDSSANESIKRYLVDSDRRIDNAFSYLGFLTTKEIIGVLFYYKRGGLLKGFLRYLRSRMFAVFAK
jgi:flavin-dependent dehydrogenase